MPSTPSPQLETVEQAQQHIAAKRRRNWWLAVLIVALPLFWFVPGAIYMKRVTQAQNRGCENNLKALFGALVNYSNLNGGRLPDAKDWWLPLENKRFIQSHDVLHCPADTQRHLSSYSMNANLRGRNLYEIKDRKNVILLYESTNKNGASNGTGEDLVRLGKDTVGLGRHHTIGYRFNYYLMADGSVRAPKNLDEVKTYKWTP